VTTDTITGTIAGTADLDSGNYGNPLTIASTGSVQEVYGTSTWAIENQGSIANPNAGGLGVYLVNGGSITNALHAQISGVYAVKFGAGAGTVDNAGLITGTSQGIILGDGGAVTNESTGSIGGGTAGAVPDGIYAANGAASIDNFGHISGGEAGVYLGYGGTLINESGGTIADGSSSYHHLAGVFTGGAATSIDNSGLITSTYAGIYLGGGGTVTNESTGTIIGGGNGPHPDGVNMAGAAGTLDNFGTIEGQYGVFSYTPGTQTVTNEITGTIIGVEDGIRAGRYTTETVDNAGFITGTSTYVVYHNGDSYTLVGNGIFFRNGTITNESTGTISGALNGIYGNSFGGGTDTVVNSGVISGGYGDYSPGSGVAFYNGGSVTNAHGGTIGGVSNGVVIRNAAGTVDNFGTIKALSIDAVVLKAGGYIRNEAGGVIAANPTAGSAGVLLQAPTGTVVTIVNEGTITGYRGGEGGGIFSVDAGISITNGSGGTIAGGYGITDDANAAATIDNAGLITGAYTGVYLLHGGTVTNESTGTISGGTDAIHFHAGGSRLVVDPGAKFVGTVLAEGSGNVLELASGTAVGTIAGFGSEYQGFQTIAIDSGASWDVAGSIAAFAGATITGFNSHDTLDITGLGFSAAGHVNRVGGNLQIIENGATYTIPFAGNFTGDFFHLADDGNGGTLVTEDTTPCFCRGTLIRTPGGDRPVESLRIGDRVATQGGAALPLKWIGRRSYRDWLAVGNADAQPILFKAGSIADGVPARDLYVSPEHAMFIDGVLVPARHLVNGRSIVKCEGVEEIDYFHLEFDRHVVILAEDAPTESFVDDDSRMLFHNADEYRRLYPDEPRRDAEFCAPRVEDGPALDTLHQALATRAPHLRTGGAAAPWGRRGKVELATPRLIAGWAYSGADAGPVPLAVLVNGAVIGRMIADRYRPDLKAAGIGDGCHGFRFTLPRELGAGDHRIEVRREVDWSVV